MVIGNWPEVRLGDLIKIKHGWPFQSKFFTDDQARKPIVVNIGNFQYSGGFRFEQTALKGYLGDYPEEYTLKPGDILLIMTCQTAGGEILGIPGRIPDDGRIYLHNQRLGKVDILVPAKVDAGFLYWLFRSSGFNRELAATASGTKILHTSPGRIEAYRFRLPSLPEQRAIASILGSLDGKIELNRRMNATLEEMARAIFHAWFVDFEPVRAKAEGRTPESVDDATAALFPDGFEVVGGREVPRGWRISSLDQIAHYRNGLALQNYPPENDSYLPVIKIAQMRTGTTEDADKASARVPFGYIVEDGDVLFSWSGSLALSIWCGGRGALNQHLFKVTSEVYPKWFYYLWTQYHLPSFQAIAASKATTMGHIQRHHLSEANVMIPLDNLLSAMSSIMEPLIDATIAGAIQSRALSALRDNLLSKLLSGELRVGEAEQLAEGQL